MLMKLTPGVKKFRIRIEQLERPTKKSGYSHSFYQYVTEKRERETKKSGLFFRSSSTEMRKIRKLYSLQNRVIN